MAANPLQVSLANTAANATPVTVSGAVTNTVLSVVGGGTEATAQRVTIASDSTGVLSVDDNGGSITVDGTVAATQSGTWNITNVSGTVSLPTGASTAANQSTIIGHVDGIETLLGTIDTDTGNIATSTTDLPNVIGTDGAAGPSKAVSIGGTQATGELEEVRVDADGHLQIDVLTMPSVTVDSEFPTAAGITDNFATPTTTSVMAMGMVYDGAAWDMLRGTAADGVLVNLGTNNDVTVTSGAITETNSGAMLTALQLIDNAVSGSGFNITQVNGEAIDVGAGTEAAAIRVTLPTDGTGVLTVKQATAANLNMTEASAAAIAASVASIDTDTSTIITNTGATVTALQIMDDWDNAASDGASVSGDVAHDTADAGEPVKIGGQARTTNPTAVADADRVNAMFDDLGRQVVVLDQVRDLETDNQITLTDTTETTLIAAAASTFHDLESVVISNSSATAVRVDFRDATGGSVRFSVYSAAGQTTGFIPKKAIRQTTANNNWTAQCSGSASSIYIYAQAVKNI